MGGLALDETTDGLLDDVIGDVARGVIDAAGFPHLGLLLDGGAAALRAEDFPDEALVGVAQDLDLDVGEVVAGVVVDEVEEEVGQPLVADGEFLGEVGLEKLAVEEGLVAGRALVEGADVVGEFAIEAAFVAGLGRATVGRWIFLEGTAEAKMGLAAGLAQLRFGGFRLLAIPAVEQSLEHRAGINAAVLADAEEDEAVNDALGGLVEPVALEQVGAIVVLEQVGAELLADIVEEVEKVGVERPRAVGLDEVALPALESERTLGERVDQAVDAAGLDALVAEEIPEFARGGVVLAEVEDLVFACVRIIEVRPGTDDVEFHLSKVGEDREGHAPGKGVALGLEDMAVVEDLGGLLGLAGETLGAVQAEDVVGPGLAARQVGAHLDVHLALGVDESLLVPHVPPESAEEGIEEIGPQRLLVVVRRGVSRMLAVE